MSVLNESMALADRMHRELARGWNTWDTRSVLRHVLLPEGLAVSLGFAAHDKLVWLSDAFFGRQELPRTTGTMLTSLNRQLTISNVLEVRSGPRTYDGSYTCLDLDLRGARFRVETTAEGDAWVALVTPLQDEPWPRVLTVHVGLLWNRQGYAQRTGVDRIVAHLPKRDIPIHADGEPADDPNLPVMSPYLALSLSKPVALSAGSRVGVAEARRRIARARAALDASHAPYGDLAEAHEAMQACLAWNVIYEPKHQRVICPVARDWNAKRGGYVLFCWDTFFTAWMITQDEPTLAYACAIEAFRGMIDGQFVPNVTQATGRASRDRSQPCVGGICLLGMHRMSPNVEAIRALWPALMAWNRWRDRERRNPQGTISLGSRPCAPRVGDPAEFLQPGTGDGAALESGMDNSPMYDDAPYDAATGLMLTEDVGTTALYIADCQALAELARAIGADDNAAELSQRADQYAAAMRRLWREDEGVYLNRRWDTGAWAASRSPTSFYPLMTGSPTHEQADRLIREHLMDPAQYFGEWMVPVSPRQEPGFTEQLYQRGRVWPPINFLVYLGLLRYPYDEARRTLVGSSLRLMMRGWREHGIVAETYSAIDGGGGRTAHTHPLYSWGALLGFMAMMEQRFVPAPFEQPTEAIIRE